MDPAVNRDQAERCLKKAQSAYHAGQFEAARRLASKSNRLCPTISAQELLSKLNNESSSHDGGWTSKDQCTKEGGSGPEAKGDTGEHDQTENAVRYTQEQVELVQRVLNCGTDHYSILMVSKTADQTEIKKAYKKLALKLHPDKNHAPKSDEAFKAVSKAYSVLSDDEKRNRYDRFGEEGLRASGASGGRSYHYEEFDPDEIFRMFFGNSFNFGNDMYFSYSSNGDGYIYRTPHRRHRHHHHHGNQQHQASGSSWLGLCQLLPLITLLLVSLFSNVLYQQPPAPYALHRSQLYAVKRITENYKIPYYVQETFLSVYGSKSKIRNIEKQVLEDYIWELKVSCNRHRMSGGGDVSKSCKRLEELFIQLRQDS